MAFSGLSFAAFGVLTVFGTGNATQVNTITTAVNSALMNYHVISKDAIPTSNLIQGIIIAVLVALILLGGVKRIAQVTEKLVPFMALFYIVLAIGVILLNLNRFRLFSYRSLRAPSVPLLLQAVSSEACS